MQPGCYRVVVQGARGAVWGPIVDAEDELEAKIKAGHLFEGCKPVEAIFLHDRGDRHHRRLTRVDALEAGGAQAMLLERRAGLVALRDRRRAVA